MLVKKKSLDTYIQSYVQKYFEFSINKYNNTGLIVHRLDTISLKTVTKEKEILHIFLYTENKQKIRASLNV